MKKSFLLFCFLLVSHSSISSPKISVFLGESHIPNTLKEETLELLPYGVGSLADTFSHQNSANAFTWGIDGKYQFENHVSLGVGIYQITNFSQTGNVLQWNIPQFENYAYQLKLKNIRGMGELNYDFHAIKNSFTPFITGGVGVARTQVFYTSNPITPINGPGFALERKTNWSFAYQAGTGIKYLLNNNLTLSLQYLYANMGKVHSSTQGSSTTLASPLDVDFRAHTLLFGLEIL